MKYIKKFEDHINEEFVGNLLAAAKGVFKNFLNALAAPFKELKDEFKKGLKREELKKKIGDMLDSVLKSSIDNINKAEDETAIIQIKDAFQKELDEKIIELDKEVTTIKESLIVEGVVKDSIIGGRVLLNVVKSKIDEIKNEYDKKFSAAKDLSEKKKSAIEWIKKVVEDSKKKMLDDNYINGLIEKYKTEKNIKGDTFKVGDTVIYLRQGKSKQDWENLSEESKRDPDKTDVASVKKITKIEGDKYFFTGRDGKEIIKKSSEIIGKAGRDVDTPLNNELKDKLGKIKGDNDKMTKIDKFVDFISNDANKDKLDEIDRLIGNDEN